MSSLNKMSESMIVDNETPQTVEKQTPTTPVVQAQVNPGESQPQKPPGMETRQKLKNYYKTTCERKDTNFHSLQV